MALNMSNATNARSKAGTKNIYENLENDINNVNKALKGQAYTTLLNTIRGYWIGADEKAFEKDLQNKINAIITEMNSMKSVLNTTLNSDYTQFVNHQSKNYQAK